MKIVPDIRFKGFKEEWNQYLIKNVASRHDNLRIPIKESKRKKGNVPYYGANGIQDYVSGYTHNGEYVLVAEDGANDLNIYPVQYVNGKVWVNNHAHVLQAKCEYGTNKFLRFAISNLNIKPYLVGCGRLKLNSEVLMTLGIKLPKLDSQIIISNYLYSQDDNIINTSKKIASLKQLKSACLISMFPQQGETVPRVRFKGFDGEWALSKLGELFEERIENEPNAEMLSVTMNNGIIKAVDNGRYDNSNSNKAKYKLVNIGDIAYNSMRMWQGASGVSIYRGIVSPAYTVVKPNDGVDSLFFSYMFKTDEVVKKFRLSSQGLTKDTWNLKDPAFSEIYVLYPTKVAEQHQIASYFRNRDIQISEQEKRLEKFKQIKAACVDKMFV